MMKIDKKNGGLVYSTDGGEMCAACRQPIGQCTCSRKKSGSAPDGAVRGSRKAKGRDGKGVTMIDGPAPDPTALAMLGKQIKTACGSGGTVEDCVIEV